MPQLTLQDALEHYRSVTDATHRFWAYFQVAAIGLVSYAWSIAPRDWLTFLGLSIAFIVFTRFNGALVMGSQSEARLTATGIKDYVVAHPEEVPTQFSSIIAAISSKSVEHIRGIYLWLTFGTLAAMWSRLMFP
jgi:hypothetical protein